jgi:hypothetical protein
MMLALQTAVIVAFITFFGTLLSTLGRDVFNRLWPKKEEK